ncbi:MAG: GntR family transcriptional regulator [Tannerella sp.]|jgi:DNA-binding transcriptional regulator YhcF (GntR family)|nr:GntR family transcriptional regulator [Tannerella sp.]
MNFKDNKAIYLQIAERICDEVLFGRYKEEERIPSVREYASIVEVNFNTVMRSFEYLQTSEIIFNKRGIGYFVSAGASARILTMRKDYFLQNELPDFFRQIDMLGIPVEKIVKMYNKLSLTTKNQTK